MPGIVNSIYCNALTLMGNLKPGRAPRRINARTAMRLQVPILAAAMLASMTIGAWAQQSTTTVSAPGLAFLGDPITLTATVSAGSGDVTGGLGVTFFDGADLLDTVPVTGGPLTGTATLTTTFFTDTGVHTITAAFNGTGTVGASNGTADVNVISAASTTTVSAAPDPAAVGEPVTFTATVSAPAGDVTEAGFQGVVFFEGADQIGTAVPVTGSPTSGTATITTTFQTTGPHTVFAIFGGTSTTSASNSPVTVAVTAAATSTAVTATPNPSAAGEAVTVVAIVSANPPTIGIPSGTVTFAGPGGLTQTIPLDGSGQAAFSSTSLTTGTITATYNGGATFGGSVGTTDITVGSSAAATVTSLSSSPNPSLVGQVVTFTASVTVGGGSPTGNVEFRDGNIFLGSTTLVGGTGNFTTTALSLGSHSITARYPGSTDLAESTSAALLQNVAVSADSLNLRAMQILASRMEALNSGDAFTSAIASAIYEGFSENGQIVTISPSGDIRLNYAPEIGSAVPWPGNAATPRSNDWRIWADLRSTVVGEWFNGGAPSTLSGWQLNALMGISHTVTPGVLVGVIGGYETANYRSDTLDGELTANGWTLGGYAGAKLGESLRAFVAAGYSGLDYDASSGSASGSFDAGRWLISGGLSGDIDMADFTLEPSLNLFGLWEHQDGYADSLGTQQSGRDFQAGRVSAGVKLMRPFSVEGAEMVPYAGLYADYNSSGDTAAIDSLGLLDSSASASSESGISARLTGGVAARFESGLRLDFGTQLGGLGAPQQSWVFNAGLKQSF